MRIIGCDGMIQDRDGDKGIAWEVQSMRGMVRKAPEICGVCGL